jgi:predicted secreted acid phosphatase
MNKLVETKELKTDYWEELVKQKSTKPIPGSIKFFV